MDWKKIVTPKRAVSAALLGFVAASVVMMIVQGLRPAAAQPGQGAAADAAPADQVVVYYFHRNVRCDSCRTIERLTGETLKRDFARELAGGSIAWRVVNVETPGNEHFLTDYDQTGQSVVVSDVRGGREVRWKDLALVWDLLHQEPDFKAYVREEVTEYLRPPAGGGDGEEAK